jgi:hypothetical protein
MSSTIEMKIINFILENESSQIKYKFPSNESIEALDHGIRKELKIPFDINYSLIDMEDETIISLSSLLYLPKNTRVLVKINDSCSKKSSPEVVNSSNQTRGISFSLNNFSFT